MNPDDLLNRLEGIDSRTAATQWCADAATEIKRLRAELERLQTVRFDGLGVQNWKCPHCGKQSDVGPFNGALKWD